MPPHSLPQHIVDNLSQQATKMALALNVRGLMNVQFAVQGEHIFVIEVNPRASRTVPFVAKVLNKPIANIAARLMAGVSLNTFNLKQIKLPYYAVKEAVFPFARFPGVDTILGPEMRSTGEVMGIDKRFDMAFAKSQIGAGSVLPQSGCAFISVREGDKQRVIAPVKQLKELGFKIIATRGTADYLTKQGIDVEPVNKVLEGRPHIVDVMKNGDVQLVINTTEGEQSLNDSKSIRRTTLMMKVPYYTTIAGAEAAVSAISALRSNPIQVQSLQDYAKLSIF